MLSTEIKCVTVLCGSILLLYNIRVSRLAALTSTKLLTYSLKDIAEQRKRLFLIFIYSIFIKW